MGKIKKRQRQRDDDGAEAEAAQAGDKNADEDEQHHRRAGFVLVAEHAAPVAGQLGLEHVGRLVDRQLWR